MLKIAIYGFNRSLPQYATAADNAILPHAPAKPDGQDLLAKFVKFTSNWFFHPISHSSNEIQTKQHIVQDILMNAATMGSASPLFLLDPKYLIANVEADGEDPIVPSLNVPTIAPPLNMAPATFKEIIPNASAMLDSSLDPISTAPFAPRFAQDNMVNNVQDMEIARI